MKCPIDATELVISERQGVEIDYCPQCRGIWLDRGEVDKLIERSQQFSQPDPRPDIRQQAAQYDRDNRYDRDGSYGRRRDDDTPAGGIGGLLGGFGGRDRDDRNGRRERGGWLGELFD